VDLRKIIKKDLRRGGGGLDLCDAGHGQGQGQVSAHCEHVTEPTGSIPREIVGWEIVSFWRRARLLGVSWFLLAAMFERAASLKVMNGLQQAQFGQP
jgi:hypothetical protein